MKVVVVYGSKYGATQKYAAWIAKALSCDIYEKSNISGSELAAYDVIIYGGGLYAGGIDGIKLLHQNLSLISKKDILIFSCGLADPNVSENVTSIRKGVEKALPLHLLSNARLFHLRGGIDYGRLSVVHKIMMGALYRLIKLKDPATLGHEERELVRTYGQVVDFTDRESTQPIVDYVAGLKK